MNEGIKAWAAFLAWLTNGEISAEEAEKMFYEMTEGKHEDESDSKRDSIRQ